jgi:uncharacterized membrane protein YqiK
MGQAEALVLEEKLQAEAKGLRSRADAYSHMGEAGVMSMMIKEMPKIAEAIAKPLESTDRMVFVSNENHGPSNLVSDICGIMAKIPELSESLTGLDLKKLVSKLVDNGQGMERMMGGGDKSKRRSDKSNDDNISSNSSDSAKIGRLLKQRFSTSDLDSILDDEEDADDVPLRGAVEASTSN